MGENKRDGLLGAYIEKAVDRIDEALRNLAEVEKIEREEKLGELLSKITSENTHKELLCSCDESTITDKIREWSVERNLHEADPNKQALKLGEEMGELFEGLVKGDEDLTKDAIGDIHVVLTIMAQQLGFTIEECIEIAYDEIKDRRGKMVDGVFIKEEDL